MLAKYLPSKKFLYTVIAVIIAIILVVLVKNINLPQKNKTTQIENTRELARQTLEIDTDGDGLKDWEEALWKTDKGMADTDGDKTSDYEEVKVNRDPTKKGPGDEFDAVLVAKSKKEIEDFKNLTLTEQLSQTLFSQYIAAKNSGEISQNSKQIILDTAVSMTEKEIGQPKYSQTSIKITDSLTSASLKKYGNELTLASQNNTSENIQHELSVLADALATEDENTLKNLSGPISLYEKMIGKILLIEVPRPLSAYHINILNHLDIIKNRVGEMSFLFSDPARAILALEEYKTYSESLVKNYVAIKDYFAKSGVIFKTEDPGYILFNSVK